MRTAGSIERPHTLRKELQQLQSKQCMSSESQRSLTRLSERREKSHQKLSQIQGDLQHLEEKLEMFGNRFRQVSQRFVRQSDSKQNISHSPAHKQQQGDIDATIHLHQETINPPENQPQEHARILMSHRSPNTDMKGWTRSSNDEQRKLYQKSQVPLAYFTDLERLRNHPLYCPKVGNVVVSRSRNHGGIRVKKTVGIRNAQRPNTSHPTSCQENQPVAKSAEREVSGRKEAEERAARERQDCCKKLRVAALPLHDAQDNRILYRRCMCCNHKKPYELSYALTEQNRHHELMDRLNRTANRGLIEKSRENQERTSPTVKNSNLHPAEGLPRERNRQEGFHDDCYANNKSLRNERREYQETEDSETKRHIEVRYNKLCRNRAKIRGSELRSRPINQQRNNEVNHPVSPKQALPTGRCQTRNSPRPYEKQHGVVGIDELDADAGRQINKMGKPSIEQLMHLRELKEKPQQGLANFERRPEQKPSVEKTQRCVIGQQGSSDRQFPSIAKGMSLIDRKQQQRSDSSLRIKQSKKSLFSINKAASAESHDDSHLQGQSFRSEYRPSILEDESVNQDSRGQEPSSAMPPEHRGGDCLKNASIRQYENIVLPGAVNRQEHSEQESVNRFANRLQLHSSDCEQAKGLAPLSTNVGPHGPFQAVSDCLDPHIQEDSRESQIEFYECGVQSEQERFSESEFDRCAQVEKTDNEPEEGSRECAKSTGLNADPQQAVIGDVPTPTKQQTIPGFQANEAKQESKSKPRSGRALHPANRTNKDTSHSPFSSPFRVLAAELNQVSVQTSLLNILKEECAVQTSSQRISEHRNALASSCQQPALGLQQHVQDCSSNGLDRGEMGVQTQSPIANQPSTRSARNAYLAQQGATDSMDYAGVTGFRDQEKAQVWPEEMLLVKPYPANSKDQSGQQLSASESEHLPAIGLVLNHSCHVLNPIEVEPRPMAIESLSLRMEELQLVDAPLGKPVGKNPHPSNPMCSETAGTEQIRVCEAGLDRSSNKKPKAPLQKLAAVPCLTISDAIDHAPAQLDIICSQVQAGRQQLAPLRHPPIKQSSGSIHLKSSSTAAKPANMLSSINFSCACVLEDTGTELPISYPTGISRASKPAQRLLPEQEPQDLLRDVAQELYSTMPLVLESQQSQDIGIETTKMQGSFQATDLPQRIQVEPGAQDELQKGGTKPKQQPEIELPVGQQFLAEEEEGGSEAKQNLPISSVIDAPSIENPRQGKQDQEMVTCGSATSSTQTHSQLSAEQHLDSTCRCDNKSMDACADNLVCSSCNKPFSAEHILMLLGKKSLAGLFHKPIVPVNQPVRSPEEPPAQLARQSQDPESPAGNNGPTAAINQDPIRLDKAESVRSAQIPHELASASEQAPVVIQEAKRLNQSAERILDGLSVLGSKIDAIQSQRPSHISNPIQLATESEGYPQNSQCAQSRSLGVDHSNIPHSSEVSCAALATKHKKNPQLSYGSYFNIEIRRQSGGIKQVRTSAVQSASPRSAPPKDEPHKQLKCGSKYPTESASEAGSRPEVPEFARVRRLLISPLSEQQKDCQRHLALRVAARQVGIKLEGSRLIGELSDELITAVKILQLYLNHNITERLFEDAANLSRYQRTVIWIGRHGRFQPIVINTEPIQHPNSLMMLNPYQTLLLTTLSRLPDSSGYSVGDWLETVTGGPATCLKISEKDPDRIWRLLRGATSSSSSTKRSLKIFACNPVTQQCAQVRSVKTITDIANTQVRLICVSPQRQDRLVCFEQFLRLYDRVVFCHANEDYYIGGLDIPPRTSAFDQTFVFNLYCNNSTVCIISFWRQASIHHSGKVRLMLYFEQSKNHYKYQGKCENNSSQFYFEAELSKGHYLLIVEGLLSDEPSGVSTYSNHAIQLLSGKWMLETHRAMENQTQSFIRVKEQLQLADSPVDLLSGP